MTVDRAILVLAGTMTLLSALLAALVSPWFLLLTGVVGANLLQSAFTGFCPAAAVLHSLGVREGCACTSTGSVSP